VGDEEARGREWEMKRRGGERECEKEGRMIWTSMGGGIMKWRCLEEKKK
jgi:hypothetical protein